MDIGEIRRRVRGVRRRLRDAGVDGLLVMGVENVRYLTGFRGHDSWALVLGRSVVLVTDSRYTEQAESECLGCRIVQRKGKLVQAAADLLGKRSDVETLGVEDSCSVALMKTLRKALGVRLKAVHHVVETGRMIKTDEEIRLIRKAGRIAFDAMAWALERLRAGMTELELAALYEYRLRSFHSKAGFETIVCFGPNGSRNHHQPGRRKLRKNDTILVDFGAECEGYISDMTRCFAVGKPTVFFEKVYRTVARAQQAAIGAVREGVRVCEVDAAAREVIRDADLPVYGHGTGHGLGLLVHELPFVAGTDKKGRLKTGQVITIEPGIYLPGKLGVRLEDDVLVAKNGSRLLSRDKRFAIKVDEVPLL
jgi:Xaa-Pro aminopeptidase